MMPAALTIELVLDTLLPVVSHPWVKELATACLATGVEAGDGWILADSRSHSYLRWEGYDDNRSGAGIPVGIASLERSMPLPLPVHTISLVSPLKPVSLSSMAQARRTLTSRRAHFAMSALRRQWGLPPYGPLFIVGLDNLPGWDGYVLSVWGTLEHTTPHPDEAPLFQVRGALRSCGMLSLVAWVRQVFYRETAAYLETRWDPETGVSMKIVGEDALRQFARLPGMLEEKLKRGLQLLDETCFMGPGRSKGSTLIPAPEFRERYGETSHQLRNHFGRRPTHEQVASELGVTERTLRRYLRNNGLP